MLTNSHGLSEQASAAEIEALIQQHPSVDEQPPFTSAEMMVMAVLCSDRRAMSVPEMLKWIVKNVPYWKENAMNYFAEKTAPNPGRLNPMLGHKIIGMDDALDRWDAPFAASDPDAVPTLVDRQWTHINDKITVPVSAGRVFLRHLLSPPRKGRFAFFELPAELRAAILEYALALPSSGALVTVRLDEMGINRQCMMLREREAAAPVDAVCWQLAASKSILAPLLVNKQMYAEAMPIFYHTNTFCVQNPVVFKVSANNLTLDRLRWLGALYFDMDASVVYSQELIDCDGSLKASIGLMQNLKVVKVKLDTQSATWNNRTGWEPGAGLFALFGSIAKDFEVEGSEYCSNLIDWIRTEAARLRSEREDPEDDTDTPEAIAEISGEDGDSVAEKSTASTEKNSEVADEEVEQIPLRRSARLRR